MMTMEEAFKEIEHKKSSSIEYSDDVPLINMTTNRKLLRLNRQRKSKRCRIFITRSIKQSLKVLHRNNKTPKTSAKSKYFLRKKVYDYKKYAEDLLDDSFEDEDYNPEDEISSDSSSVQGETDTNSSTQMKNIRDKGWNRRKRPSKNKRKRGFRRSHVQDKDEELQNNKPITEKLHQTYSAKQKNDKQKTTSTRFLSSALQKSKQIEVLRRRLMNYHTARLDNLLISNGLRREKIYPDGNCFNNAVLLQVKDITDITDSSSLRAKIVEHLRDNRSHYKHFLNFPSHASDEDKDMIYNEYLDDLKQCGHWNLDLADCMPLAIANIFQRIVRIYSSKISNPVCDIKPDLLESDQSSGKIINLALIAITGKEHYDGVKSTTATLDISHLPERSSCEQHSTDEKNAGTPKRTHKTLSPRKTTPVTVTPRKNAVYKSPIKKQLFRKRKANPSSWLRNKRKHCRDHGLAYTGKAGKQIAKRSIVYKNCEKCRFKCSHKISEDSANRIFKIYWGFGSYEKQRNFICQHVEKSEVKRQTGSRKHASYAYFLQDDNKQVRVCKRFFLGVLSIGKKTVEVAMKKKNHGMFAGSDLRGKQQSANKTPDSDVNFIRQHIESFPTVPSHYTRKHSARGYLDSCLTIRKMYQLYEEECKKTNRRVCRFGVYRNIFCTQYNLSFHKPKKDQCTLCSVYEEKKAQGDIAEKLEEDFQNHQNMKRLSRESKTLDKARAKTDKTFVASTFDLEAVLPTPYTRVGDVYYKRCLSTYNLSFYNLGDKTGTCYIWDETNGGRGSCEIGTCLLSNINSLTEKSPHVKEVTYYSDTCGGQNRNQFVASALLFAVNNVSNLEIINHKFFERGHSEMESDSIHSAIEFAKRNTTVHVPSQWDTIISMARKKNPYIVIPLKYDDIYDLKLLRKETCKNMKTAANGDKINWLKIKWLQFRKAYPNSIFINYSFDEAAFLEVKTKTSSARGRPQKPALKQLYHSKLPVSVAKMNDLLSLCATGIIPRAYHEYYENLTTSATVKDQLLESDVEDEENYDTDE